MEMKNLRPGPAGVEPTPSTAKEKGFWALNWLRFALALYLVLFHTLRVTYTPIKDSWLDSVLSLGNMATSIFFVLSGFLLTHAYVVMKKGREINRRNFWIARFSTLYPLHVVALFLTIGPAAATIFAKGGITVAVDALGFETRILEQWEVALSLFMTVTLTNAWNPFYLVFNGPSWSLSALGFYYLIFPMIALKIYRMKSLKAALLFLGIAFFLPGVIADLPYRTDAFTTGLLHRNPIVRLPLFVAGMVLCVLFARNPTIATRRKQMLYGLLIVATAALAIVLDYRKVHLHIIQNGLYFPASLAIIWLCAAARPSLHPKLRYWGDRLGAASLPMFLLHVPLFTLFRKTEQVVAVWPSASGGLSSVLASARHVEQSMALYPLYLVLLVITCVVVQERFVTRLQAAIRNRFSARDMAKKPAVAPQAETGS